MTNRISILLIVGMFFLIACYSTEEPNHLSKGGKDEIGMYIEFFNVDDDGKWQPTDFGGVSGYVMVVLRNIPSDAEKVFVYLDEVQIGSSIIGEGAQFGFESSKFLNGPHKIKLVSINSAGGIINYQPINAYFKNLLYNVHCDDFFHPDQDYHYSGFYDGKKPLQVKITDLYDNVLWSNTYSGNYIDINIPGSAFGTEQSCELSITDGSYYMTEHLAKKFKREDFSKNTVNEEQNCAKGENKSIPDCSKKTTRSSISIQRKQELTKCRHEEKSIEFFQADKYFVPPTGETVAILLYAPYGEVNGYQPMVLFGDKALAEKLMGELLEPEKIIEGREWLEKIMDAYKTALKGSEEKKFHHAVYKVMGQIVFVTAKKGYIREIDVDAYNAYDDYMESSILKKYFYELGLTEKPLPRKPSKEFKAVVADKYFVPPIDETTAILLYGYTSKPVVLIGDKEQTEQIMGMYLNPKEVFEDRSLLKKIMEAYRSALKEAEEGRLEDGSSGSRRILFVTPEGGYMRTISINEDAVHDNGMKSELLKKYFDEIGITKELLTSEQNKVIEH